jgi:adenylyltransferase/sulfurtransferase
MTNIGGTLIPLQELGARLEELEPHRDREIVVVCRSGARSATAVRMMLDAGFERVVNLRGGLMAWADKIDSSVPRY